MDPNGYTDHNYNQQPTVGSQWLKRVLVVVVVLLLVWVGWLIYISSTFHIVRTSPSLNSVGNVSPFIKLYFNEPLSSKGLSVQTNQDITKATINGKIMTVSLSQNLTAGNTYTIVINHLASSGGRLIHNKRLTFVARNIAFSDLPAEQQQAAIASQDQYPYSVNSINYVGFDALTNTGLTSDQVQLVKQNLYSYSATSRNNYQTMTIDTNSITSAPFDPNSSATRQVMFTVTLDKTVYRATVGYIGLSDANLLLQDSSGATVYDSTAGHD